LEQWAEEEGAMLPHFDTQESHRRTDSIGKLGGAREYEEMDDTVYGGDIYLGSLTERILSTLREEGIKLVGSDLDDEDLLSITKPPKFRSTTEMMVLEDRLKNEIRHLGLIGDDDVSISHFQSTLIVLGQDYLQYLLADRLTGTIVMMMRSAWSYGDFKGN
jgi:hypothetical protein